MNGIEKIKNGFPRAHILSTTYLRYVARQGLGRVNASPKFRPLGQVINFAFTSSKEINWVGKARQGLPERPNSSHKYVLAAKFRPLRDSQ